MADRIDIFRYGSARRFTGRQLREIAFPPRQKSGRLLSPATWRYPSVFALKGDPRVTICCEIVTKLSQKC